MSNLATTFAFAIVLIALLLWATLRRQHQEVMAALHELQTGEDKIMDDMTTLEAALTDETDAEKAAIILLDNLAAQVAATAPTQAAIDRLAATIRANKTNLAAALARDTVTA